MGTNFIFEKKNKFFFENLKQLQGTANVFAFYKKLISKQRTPFRKQSFTSVKPLHFYKKIFHPNLYGQIRKSQAPLYKGQEV